MCTWHRVLPALLVVPFTGLAGCAKKDGEQPQAGLRDAGVVSAAPRDGGDLQPTADDCAAAVANMRRVVPDLVEGDEADRQDCLAMPHEIVVCLKTVKTPAEADACVRDYADKHGGPDVDTAPVEPATAADCKRAIAHVAALLPTADQKDLDREALVDQCRQTYSKDEVTCLLAAKTMTEVDACAPASD